MIYNRLILIISLLFIVYFQAFTIDKHFEEINDTDWTNGSNWNPSGVPGVNDNVTIDAGKICDLNTGTITVQKIIIYGVLNNNVNATLISNNATGYGFNIEQDGIYNNYGSLEVGNCSNGAIWIDDNGLLNNYNEIVTTTGFGGYGMFIDDVNSKFDNKMGAIFTITETRNNIPGIGVRGALLNEGTINLESGVIGNGIVTFSIDYDIWNGPNGIININDVGGGGISSYSFSNEGEITIACNFTGFTCNNNFLELGVGSIIHITQTNLLALNLHSKVIGEGLLKNSTTYNFYLKNIAPGNSIGTINLESVGQLIFTNNGEYDAELSSSSNDLIAIEGDLEIGTGQTLNVSLLGGYVPTVTAEFTIIDATGTIVGVYDNLNFPSPAMDDFVVDYSIPGKVIIKHMSALPIVLSNFNLDKLEKKNQLNWTTSSEINNAGFEIEHQQQDKWTTIGYVKGNNYTSTSSSYIFFHATPPSGHNYYRLKQIDNDGKYEYSEVISCNNEISLELIIYPNPTQGKVIIVGSEEIDYQMTDISGKLVLEGSTNDEIDISALSIGSYYILLSKGGLTYMERIVKQ